MFTPSIFNLDPGIYEAIILALATITVITTIRARAAWRSVLDAENRAMDAENTASLVKEKADRAIKTVAKSAMKMLKISVTRLRQADDEIEHVKRSAMEALADADDVLADAEAELRRATGHGFNTRRGRTQEPARNDAAVLGAMLHSLFGGSPFASGGFVQGAVHDHGDDLGFVSPGTPLRKGGFDPFADARKSALPAGLDIEALLHGGPLPEGVSMQVMEVLPDGSVRDTGHKSVADLILDIERREKAEQAFHDGADAAKEALSRGAAQNDGGVPQGVFADETKVEGNGGVSRDSALFGAPETVDEEQSRPGPVKAGYGNGFREPIRPGD